MSSVTTRSENELGEKWDKCLADTAIKMGSGLGLGIIFSLVLFKRRKWPLIFGLGSGFGMGYANCQHEMNQPHILRAHQLKVKPKQ